MRNFKLFSFSLQLQYDIIKQYTGSIPFSNRNIKEEKKLAMKENNERRKYRNREYKFL